MLAGWKWEDAPTKEDLEKRLVTEEQKYAVPQDLENDFTPAEVEEVSVLFEELDLDGSGSIDIEELRVVFDKMEETVTDDRLQELIDEVDEDGSGTVDYEEFFSWYLTFLRLRFRFCQDS